jgi:hypothetical protein
MTDLPGFTPVVKINPDPGPQSLQVPTDQAGAAAQAQSILTALWSAVEAGLTSNVSIEILKHTDADGGATFCRISPLHPDGFTKTTANPGDYIVVDGVLKALTPDEYAAQFAAAPPA